MGDDVEKKGGFVYAEERIHRFAAFAAETSWRMTKYDEFPDVLTPDGETPTLYLRNHVWDPSNGDCIPVYEVDPEYIKTVILENHPDPEWTNFYGDIAGERSRLEVLKIPGDIRLGDSVAEDLEFLNDSVLAGSILNMESNPNYYVREFSKQENGAQTDANSGFFDIPYDVMVNALEVSVQRSKDLDQPVQGCGMVQADPSVMPLPGMKA